MDISKLHLDEAAQNAKAAYYAIPNSAEILARMELVSSPQDALRQIYTARELEMNMRRDLASTWGRDVLILVEKLITQEIGDMNVSAQKIHPLLGPLFAVRCPNGAWEAFKAPIFKNLKVSGTAHRNAKNRDSQKKAAKSTNQFKEAKRMKGCVEHFVSWSKRMGKGLSLGLVAEFPKVSGMSRIRAQSLLTTLFSAQAYPSVKSELLDVLRKEGFPNATQQAVDECLNTLESCVKV